MEVDRCKDTDEISFVPSAVIDSAGWHEPKLIGNRQCWKGRFQVLRHRVDNGGRRWRAAHDKLLHESLQSKVRRKEGTSSAQGITQAKVTFTPEDVPSDSGSAAKWQKNGKKQPDARTAAMAL